MAPILRNCGVCSRGRGSEEVGHTAKWVLMRLGRLPPGFQGPLSARLPQTNKSERFSGSDWDVPRPFMRS
jgi:hypothetical protein